LQSESTPNSTCIFKIVRRLSWNYQIQDGRSTPTQEQFSLLFYGPNDCNLGQGTFELEHETMGTFPLFLVPIGPDHQGLRYQAVFNRFVKTQP